MSEAVTGVDGETASDPLGRGFWTVHQGDARQLADFLPRGAQQHGSEGAPFIQTTITSPPYANLVDYGAANQIGFGQSYQDYLAACRTVFEDVYRWTLDGGSLWLVADSLMTPNGRGTPSRLVPLPFDLAAEAAKVGWTLREVIVWRKDRTRPWSHPGKLRNGFEYVLFFVKSKSFKFNVDRLRETSSLKSWWVKYPERHNPWGMTPDNVWDIPIPVQGSWADSSLRHACPFPPELVRRMVALSSEEGDVVFDPFAGSGMVVATAESEGRRALGVELNPEYVEAFHQRVRPVLTRRSTAGSVKPVGLMTQRLLELRVLKYPKELAKQLLREGFTAAQLIGMIVDVESINWTPAQTGYASIICTVVVSEQLSEIERARLSKAVEDATSRAPLSRYGLRVSCSILPLTDILEDRDETSLAVYTKGRTWNASHVIPASALAGWLREQGSQSVVPIVSELQVNQSLEEYL
ncbi:MAG: hypothetical protein KF680_06530 [Cryobacterium sp.]|nr:hypothetical protein [Cryobacterium sp.]